MRSEWRFFGILTVFLYFVAALYAWWTHANSEATTGEGRIEWVGVVALILSSLLTTMVGLSLWMVSRRIDPRPEDRPDAEIADGAGEIGFFSPGSYWPFGLALAALVTAIGMAFWQAWLIGIGLVAVLLGTGGLLFEYYTGTRRVEH